MRGRRLTLASAASVVLAHAQWEATKEAIITELGQEQAVPGGAAAGEEAQTLAPTASWRLRSLESVFGDAGPPAVAPEPNTGRSQAYARGRGRTVRLMSHAHSSVGSVATGRDGSDDDTGVDSGWEEDDGESVSIAPVRHSRIHSARHKRRSMVMKVIMDAGKRGHLQHADVEFGAWVAPEHRTWFESFFILRRLVYILVDTYEADVRRKAQAFFFITVGFLAFDLALKPFKLWQSSVLAFTCWACLLVIEFLEATSLQGLEGHRSAVVNKGEALAFALPIVVAAGLGINIYWGLVVSVWDSCVVFVRRKLWHQ